MTGAQGRPARLAIVIGDPAMRSRVAAALVLDGVDVIIAASLEDVRDGIPTVTDHATGVDGAAAHPPGGPSAMLSAVALMRDPAGELRIGSHVPVTGTDACAIVRAANDLLARPDRPAG